MTLYHCPVRGTVASVRRIQGKVEIKVEVQGKVEVEVKVEIRAKTRVPTPVATQSGMRPDEHREILRETQGILDSRFQIDDWRTAERGQRPLGAGNPGYRGR
jgi:hypothetical protein